MELLHENYEAISDYLQIPIAERNNKTLNFKRSYASIQNDSVGGQIKNVVLVICESFSMYKS